MEKAEKECEEYDFSEESESSSSSSPALSEESEDEGSEFYKPGGYHPTHIGEIYNGRYRVICKLGWGHYSTVWKVFDMADKKIRAMKIVKSSKNYTRAALDEIKILRAITMNDPHDRKFCTHLIDSFKHSGPNGIRKYNNINLLLFISDFVYYIFYFYICLNNYVCLFITFLFLYMTKKNCLLVYYIFLFL